MTGSLSEGRRLGLHSAFGEGRSMWLVNWMKDFLRLHCLSADVCYKQVFSDYSGLCGGQPRAFMFKDGAEFCKDPFRNTDSK